MDYYLAVDIGATSGRHIIACIENGKIVTEEIYRFSTHGNRIGEKWEWDCCDLINKIVEGMRICKEKGKIPVSMAVDAWGGDCVLIGNDGEVIGNTSDYRNQAEYFKAEKELGMVIPEKEYFESTGTGRLPIDTVYQLMAIKHCHADILEKTSKVLMVASAISYLLTGVLKQEYTAARTSGLLSVKTQDWDADIIAKAGLPMKIFPELCLPGDTLGKLKKEICERVGYECNVMAVASHDTSSAFLAVPSDDNDQVVISSGTWSIIGILLEQPILTPCVTKYGFSNEGAYPHIYRLSKTIPGMQILEKIKNGLQYECSYQQLIQKAREAEDINSRMDLDDLSLAVQSDMKKAIRRSCQATGQKVPETDGEILSVFFRSLACYYADTVKQIEKITGEKVTGISIVGGGSRNDYLNELTAQLTGCSVCAGPVEAAAVGNLICQMIATEEISGKIAARQMCKESFDIKTYN